MDKKVVRASYESCLNALARLNAYATSSPSIGITEINARQDILAADDLILFCIHARRLAENMGLKDLLNQTASRSLPFKVKPIIFSTLRVISCSFIVYFPLGLLSINSTF